MEQQSIEEGWRGDGRQDAHDQQDDDQLEDRERPRAAAERLSLARSRRRRALLVSYRLHEWRGLSVQTPALSWIGSGNAGNSALKDSLSKQAAERAPPLAAA